MPLIEILEAINYLHELDPSVIHRNIKPENILINKSLNNKFIKISDFGLAVTHTHTSQSHTQNKGTEKYMAPEVKISRKYGTKADVYSIGVVIQEMFNFDIKYCFI